MGIKGFYEFCCRDIKSSYKTVKMTEEIAAYTSKHQNPPLIIINLSTLSYHFKLHTKDLLCGYQLNKIKFDFENFLSELIKAGAELEFVFKKSLADDSEWKRRRLNDYHMGCDIMKMIETVKSFEKLNKIIKSTDKFPYNPMILLCLIQSAEKFGKVHGCNSIKGKPSVQHIELARLKSAAWILGLDTFYFLLPGEFKIWCDIELNMERMTVRELDPNVVMSHLELKPEEAPLYACLVGDLQSNKRNIKKVSEHFGSVSLFKSAANFIRKLETTTLDEHLKEIVSKIFGSKYNSEIFDDFKKTIKSFEIQDVELQIDPEVLAMVKDEFLNIAEDVLLNTPIFVNPASLDMQKTDMKNINELVLPFIQKTAGALLKNLQDQDERKLILLANPDGDFVETTLEVVFPEFEIPPLKDLIAGKMDTLKMYQLMFWVTGLVLEDFELALIPQEHVADVVILLFLMKNESLKLIDARCILKTLVDARRRAVPLEVSTEYPEIINERAFRVTFLYSKIYFFFHSCMSSLGMKYLCPDLQFDGVYFQKMYTLNILEDVENQDLVEETPKYSQTEIIDEFVCLINQ